MILSFRRKELTGVPFFLLSFSVVLVLFSGCRTVPQYTVRDYPSLVSERGALFVSFNIQADMALADAYLERQDSGKDLVNLVKRTDRVSFSFKNDSLKTYAAVAEGHYPPVLTTLFLGTSTSWITHKDVYTWWEEKGGDLKLALPIGSVAIFSTGSITPLLKKFKIGERGFLPEYVKKEMEESAVTLYTDSPSPALFSAFGVKRAADAVVELNLYVIREKDEGKDSLPASYRLKGYIALKNPEAAKLFTTGLKLGLLTMAVREGDTAVKKLIREHPFTVEDARIIFNNVHLSLPEIMSLTDER